MRYLIAALCLYWLSATPANAQFIKQVDPEGHVTYSDDPSFDHQPEDEDYDGARDAQRELEALQELNRRASPAPQPSRRPAVTIRRRTHCQRVTRTLCER